MFEAVKLGRCVDKQTFKAAVPELRTQLLQAQRELRERKVPLVILVCGVDAAGKGEVVNRIQEWLDTRGVQVHAFWDETDEERQRPRYWRFWRAMPSAGEISIMFGGWYQCPLEQSLHKRHYEARWERQLRRIREFERMLIMEGALIVKLWYHLGDKEQRKRLKELARDDRSRWNQIPKKTKFRDHYKRFEHHAQEMIRQTDIGRAPWTLIEATDERYRDLTTGQTLQRAMQARIAEPQGDDSSDLADPELPSNAEAHLTLLDKLDLGRRLEKRAYDNDLARYQEELNDLSWDAYKDNRSTVLVFEGVDAAGKGGAIRRITQAVDARLYRTIPIAAPTDEERGHHYLWRFWRHIPRSGRITIFDRSWYGRVLVERVEGFASHHQWRRAFLEINEFEEQLHEADLRVIKFWLQISSEEQLQRFKAREVTPYKQHKITAEDWRNRERWDDYRTATNEMLTRTSTDYAPWHLVAANDKRYARIKVLRTVIEALRKG